MKTNKKFLFGILATILVFGMMLVACDNNPSSGGSGTFTLTEIPETYNGKYAYLVAGDADPMLYIGGKHVSIDGGNAVLISKERVSLPMCSLNTQSGKVAEYSGSGTFNFLIGIVDHIDVTSDDYLEPSEGVEFHKVKFSSGSASRKWGQLDENYLDTPYTAPLSGTWTASGRRSIAFSGTIFMQDRQLPILF